MAGNKRMLNVSLPTLNLLGNSRLLFRVVICRSAMFSVPPPPFPKLKPLLRFGEEEQSNASKHSRLLRQPRMRSP